MDAYCTATVNNLKSRKYSDMTVVLGNESCDLDSAVSALVYAAFLYWQYSQIKCKVCTRMNRDERVYKDEIFVPVLNVDREDFDLKTEVAFCLKEHGIDETKLVFRNDIDLEQIINATKTNVVLVDHHILSKQDRFLTPHVTEIIDHRPIDKTEWRYNEDTRTTTEIVGSCSTLVTDRIKSLSALIGDNTDFFKAYPIGADLLHSAIILDTVNFSKEVDKATPHDKEIVLFLESVLRPSNFEDNRKSKLERLVEARKDVSALTPAQLLRKDVKIVADVLVPSFPILVEEFFQKPDALNAVREALVLRDCSLALLLGMSLTGGLQRDAAVYAVEQRDRVTRFAKHLQDWTHPRLELSPRELATAPGCLYFRQLNLSASRKQFMPATNAFLQNYQK